MVRRLLSILAACSSPAPVPPQPAQLVPSNVLRADYAGSEACADCHHEISEA